MVGKEPPSDLPRCCSLLLPCYPGRELLAATAASGALLGWVSRQQSSSDRRETAQHLPARWVLAAQGRDVRKSKANLPRANHPRASKSSSVLLQCFKKRCLHQSLVNSKTTLQTKTTRLSSRAAGNPLQLVPCPSHGVPSTHVSSQDHVLYPN